MDAPLISDLFSEMKQWQAGTARLKRMHVGIAMQNERLKDALAKKVMRSSLKREMAQHAVASTDVNVTLSCRAFAICDGTFDIRQLF